MKARYLKIILLVVALISLIILIVKFLDFQEVIRSARAFRLDYLFLMFLLSIGYLGLKGLRFVSLVRPLDDLRASKILKGYLAGLAFAMIPGGVSAARAGFLQQAGVPVEKSSASITTSIILDVTGLIVGLLLSGLWYQYTLKPVLVVIGLLVVFGIVFLIPKSRRWISNAAQWIAEKLHFLEQWEGFLNSLKETVSKSILLESAGITVLAYISQIALFNLCLRGLNLDLPLSRLIFAYFLPTVLGVLSTLPAGIGVTDASMVGILASASNTSRETAAAAIIFFRLFTVLLPALLGFMLYFLGWRGEEESLDE